MHDYKRRLDTILTSGASDTQGIYDVLKINHLFIQQENPVQPKKQTWTEYGKSFLPTWYTVPTPETTALIDISTALTFSLDDFGFVLGYWNKSDENFNQLTLVPQFLAGHLHENAHNKPRIMLTYSEVIYLARMGVYLETLAYYSLLTTFSAAMMYGVAYTVFLNYMGAKSPQAAVVLLLFVGMIFHPLIYWTLQKVLPKQYVRDFDNKAIFMDGLKLALLILPSIGGQSFEILGDSITWETIVGKAGYGTAVILFMSYLQAWYEGRSRGFLFSISTTLELIKNFIAEAVFFDLLIGLFWTLQLSFPLLKASFAETIGLNTAFNIVYGALGGYVVFRGTGFLCSIAQKKWDPIPLYGVTVISNRDSGGGESDA